MILVVLYSQYTIKFVLSTNDHNSFFVYNGVSFFLDLVRKGLQVCLERGKGGHIVLVNHLGGLRNSVVRLNDHTDMTIAVYRGRNSFIGHTDKGPPFYHSFTRNTRRKRRENLRPLDW